MMSDVGLVLLAPFDVVLTDLDVVEPDLLYSSHERARAILTSACLRGAPELAVEIGSPSTRKRDEAIKKRLYERAGMDEYWFLDPEIDVIRVYRRSGSTFGPPLELSLDRSDVLTTPLLPGLELALADVFSS